MKHSILAVVTLASLSAVAALSAGSRESLQVGSPVEKVVNLLKNLQARVNADGRKEQAMYDKYSCWCEKTTARKATAIEDAKADLRRLGQEILGLKGKVATLIAEIEELTGKIKENQKTQAEATTLRQKENAEYMAESTEMKEALAALEKAVVILKDGTFSSASSLLQSKGASQAEVTLRVKDALASLPMKALSAMAPEKLSLLKQYAEDISSGKIRGKARYAPQSMTIQGILRNMYDTFGNDLMEMDTEEGNKNRDFEGLMATLQEELATMENSMKKKEAEKAEAEVTLAETTQAYDDTEAQMNSDIKFFDATKEACTTNAGAWKERSQIRTEELEAISKAIEILHSDEARELFDKSIKPGIETFVQVSKHSSDEATSLPAKKAYEALKTQARRSQSLRLARVAAQVRLAKAGHFDTVIVEIDKLMGDLKVEQTDDTAKRDQCKDEYKNIKSVIADLTWKIEVNDRNIQEFADNIEKSEGELERTQQDIDQTTEDIAEMVRVREAENADFKQAKLDDEDAIKLLDNAKKVLNDFYSKHGIDYGVIQGGEGVDLLQQWYFQGPEFAKSEDQAPEFKLTGKGHRKAEGKGVLSLLSMIMQDLQDEITNAVAAEAAAQAAFEKAKKAAEDHLEELGTKKTNLETTIARLKEEKGAEEQLKTDNEKDLSDENDYKTKITPDCDFVIGKFEERMQKRAAEMKGLSDAKEYLVGYKENWSGGAIEAPAI